MNRKAPQKRSQTSKAKRSKPAPRRSNSPTKPTKTNALRIQAQIAMLKRALLAADDDALPHRAICDYLKTLSQMAKLEYPGTLGLRGKRAIESNATGDAPLSDSTPVEREMQSPEAIRHLLQQTIQDIYGLSAEESTDNDSPHDAAGARNNAPG